MSFIVNNSIFLNISVIVPIESEENGLYVINLSNSLLTLWLARVSLSLVLLYIIWGINKLLEPLMNSVQQILSQQTNWNPTVTKFTLIAFALNSVELLYPSIELYKSGLVNLTNGPLFIIGSGTFNLLVLVSFSIFMSPEKSNLRIQKIGLFLYSFAHSLFSFIWMFVALYVITPYHIEVWEAVLMVLLYIWLVLTAYIIEKNVFGQKRLAPVDGSPKDVFSRTSKQNNLI